MLKYHFSRTYEPGNFLNGVIAIECFLSSPSSPPLSSQYLPEQFTSKGDWMGNGQMVGEKVIMSSDTHIYMFINIDSGVPMNYIPTGKVNVFNIDRARAVYNLKKQHPEALDTKIWTF